MMWVVIVGALTLLVLNLRLWNENLWYRVYMHQYVKTRYDPAKAPFVRTGPRLPAPVLSKAALLAGKCCQLKSSHLTDKYRAFNANEKGGAIYWHQLQPYLEEDPHLKECMLAVQAFAKQWAETTTGKKLHPFAFSMWNCFVLRYTGKKGSFGWHYDSEDPTDCRVLICVDRTATCGAVEFMDEEGETKTVDLEQGQCYMLRGSTSFHRVTHNQSEEDVRLMLGCHFSETPNKTTKNLCYFATLTGWQLSPATRVFLNQHKH